MRELLGGLALLDARDSCLFVRALGSAESIIVLNSSKSTTWRDDQLSLSMRSNSLK